MSDATRWAVRLYDAEGRLIGETAVNAEGCLTAVSQACNHARALLRGKKLREIDAKAVRLVAQRVAHSA